jgi:hypothetical protein
VPQPNKTTRLMLFPVETGPDRPLARRVTPVTDKRQALLVLAFTS